MLNRCLVKLFLLVGACLSLCSKHSYATTLQSHDRVSLNVGETHEYAIPDAVKIHVSRKGIIHLVHKAGDNWKLTALKSGVVAIEIKVRGEESRIVYADVKPRKIANQNHLRNSSSKIDVTNGELNCSVGIEDEQVFELQTKVELYDEHELERSGIDSQAQFALSYAKGPSLELSAGLNPQHSMISRKILGDPLVLARVCEDIHIRAGGEDEVDARSDQGQVVSTWKNHGLDIKVQIQPLSTGMFHIPFSVELRTPSKGKGNYSLSEVSSSLNLKLGQPILAAIINLKSSSLNSKDSFDLSSVPIIGPLFRGFEESFSNSKLLLWIQLNQKSELSATP